MRKHTSKKLIGLLLALASYAPGSFAIDNAHFWKVARLHDEQTDDFTAWWERDQKYGASDWLTKFNVSYGYGSAHKGWNNHGNKTELLNIYGEQNMLYLFTNVPPVPSETNYAEFLGNIVNSSLTNGTFGLLEFNGKFRLNEVNLDFRQNFKLGLFIEAHLPIRDMSIKDIKYTDESPATGMFSKQNPDWIRFLNNLNQILNNHGLNNYNSKFSRTAVGDLSILVGWDHINQDLCSFIKWFEVAFKFGCLFPTGTKANHNKVFSLPSGYDGHWGIPIAGHFDLGIRNWLVWAVRAGAIFFFDNTLTRRIKTFNNQNGFIKLAQGRVKEKEGTVWYVGTDIKFDHIFKGFSFLLGYSYNKGERNHLTPKGTSCCCETGTLIQSDTFTKSIVDSDSTLHGWSQQVLHFMWDYDFSVHCSLKDKKYAPRLDIFYNLLVDGKNIFDTNLVGGGVGLDIRWDF